MSTWSRHRAFVLTGLLAAGVAAPARAAAQPASDCAPLECAPVDRSAADRRLWIGASEVHAVKLEFVEGLQAFTRAQAGTFGDEGMALGRSVAAMQSALTRWDAAVEEFRRGVVRTPSAEGHVALATLLLDRFRVAEALRELDAARRRDAGRADIDTLQAMAYGMSGRSADAVGALRRAVAADPDDPSSLYALAQHSLNLSRPQDAARALRGFSRALQAKGAPASTRAPGSPLFERVDLLRQPAGVAPIFPQARYADGFAALRSGDYASAVSRFAAATVADPLTQGDPEARRRVVAAAAALREGRLQEALLGLQAAVALAPGHAETRRVLGLVYWIDDQEGRSLEHLRTASRLAPDDDRARVALADVLISARRYAEAERELRQALDAGLRSGQIHHRLAQLYQQQSLLPQAAQAFEASEAFGPIVGRDRFLLVVASLLVNRADLDGAATAYARRVEVNPNSAEAHRQLGEVYFLQGRHDEALAEFSAATWLDPQDARAHAAAGQVHVRTQRHADAVVALQRALALDADQREARYALGTSLMRLGRADEARRELDIYQRMQAEAESRGRREFQLDALRREGTRHVVAGTYDRAVGVFQEALVLDHGDARSRRDLGVALLRAGRPLDAVTHLETALAAGPSAEVSGHLADAYRAAGRPDEAARQVALRRELVERTKLDRIRILIGG